MGSRLPSSTRLSCCCLLLLVFFLHPPACLGYRLRGSAPLGYAAPPAPDHGVLDQETHRLRPVTSFALPGGRAFDYLPRGLLIPPSAPSKRHNSVLDSAGRAP